MFFPQSDEAVKRLLDHSEHLAKESMTVLERMENACEAAKQVIHQCDELCRSIESPTQA
jgi:hypothetical protein